ncbi:TonB-dependent receptor [Thalassotalea fonticola]|uniref:TonB-dependent receptor n=1 Tax=Thalassotalea fonticola TaxID=3065649 RepID=A0ABZ0GQI8_9GAMM|nr:TonB-dependent receptor [Colwelliaceae bacterium S1-1]
MYSNNKLAKAVRLALVFGASATAGISANAFAAEEVTAEEEVERIEVTGSRIKRTDMEAASPISVFTAEDIAVSGVSTVEGFIKSIPAMNGGQIGSNVNNGNRGFATASLRGLGDGRTLILINGRRFNSGDLNSIPTSFIERVEVVRDGASTVYGSDAIAGVINFITKKDFEGVEVSAQYDVTSEDDGETKKFSIVTGTSSDKGNVVFSVDYTDREAVSQGDRSYSECPLWDDGVGSKPYCGGSSHSHLGRVNVPEVNGLGLDAGRYITQNGEAVPFSTADHGYNYAATSYLVTPAQVFSVNAASTYEITDSMSIFAEAGFSNRQSSQQMAPAATFWSAPVPATHPDNIYGVDLSVNRRITEGGGRGFEQDAEDYRIVAGLEGEFDNGWGWDVAYNYSRFVDSRIMTGELNRPNTETLLDPALCAADDDCPGLWNPFAEGTMTAEQHAYASVTFSPVRKGQTTQFLANLTGDLGSFELPGGPIQWATGYERRIEEYLNEPDGAEALGQVYGQSGDRTEGSYTVEEMYAEFNFPILAGLPFAERLTLTAAVRTSDYSNQDDTATNTKFGIEWEPVEGLLTRATFAEGFRAPSITELFDPQEQSAISYTDPCWDYGLSSNATLKANCAADGLPADFNSDSQSNSVIGGNPELEPEESESFTAGIVYSGFENFSIAIDYFNIEITDGVGTAGTDNIAESCYNSTDFSSPLCDLIKGNKYGPIDTPPHPTSPRRNVSEVLSGVLVTNANLSTFETSGIDFDFSHNMDIFGGNFVTTLNGTYLDQYDYTLVAGGEKIKASGKVAADQWTGNPAVFAEIRANLGFTFATDNYNANITFRYQSEGDDLLADDTTLDSVADSIVYTDVQGTWFVNDTYTLSAGARNLLDETPPYMSNYDDSNTVNYSYDLPGAYYYLKATAKF